MQENDFQWFLEHYDQIYNEHGECYVAIKDKTILGVYHSHLDALRQTAKTEKLGSFIVQHCNGNESGYTVRIASMNFEHADCDIQHIS